MDIDLFERLCHAAMQVATTYTAEGGICLFAQLIVAKIIHFYVFCILSAYDAFLPQFVQSTHQFFFVLPAGTCQDCEGKRTTNYSSQICQFACKRRELRESCRQNRMYRRGQCRGRLRQEYSASVVLFPFVLFQCSCSYHFHHEQRVAFCLVLQPVNCSRIKLTPRDMLSQRCCLSGIEWSER